MKTNHYYYPNALVQWLNTQLKLFLICASEFQNSYALNLKLSLKEKTPLQCVILPNISTKILGSRSGVS